LGNIPCREFRRREFTLAASRPPFRLTGLAQLAVAGVLVKLVGFQALVSLRPAGFIHHLSPFAYDDLEPARTPELVAPACPLQRR
jgi:hypothetical protein